MGETEAYGGAQLESGGEKAGGGSLEGGVHSPLKFHNLECFVPFQFAADQVLLKRQQH